jgi:hypothetical protein
MLGNAKEQWWPVVPIRLCDKKLQRKSNRFFGVVDSGSAVCLFRAEFLAGLGLRLEDGDEDVIQGVGNAVSIPVFFHRVHILVCNNWQIEVSAGFSRELAVTGILGRIGFFDSFRISFDQSIHPPVIDIDKIEYTARQRN